MKLSAHFSLAELTVTNSQLPNVPDEATIENLKRLAVFLEKVRAIVGRPITVTSAYRSPAVNRRVGGSATSAHVLGFAADIKVAGMTPREVCKAIASSGLLFDQLILEAVSKSRPDGAWTHIGIGPKSRQQILTMKAGRYFSGLQR